MASPDKYFAAAAAADIGAEVQKKVDTYYSWTETSEIARRLERAFRYYFGLSSWGISSETSEVIRGGDEGELAQVRVNHCRALAQTLYNLIGGLKIGWIPVASSEDYDARSQAILARSVLEYYWTDGSVQQKCLRALEESIPLTEGFVFTEWDESLGELIGIDPTTQLPQKTGDVRVTNLSSWDIIRDPRKRTYEDGDWAICRMRRNKFELAARYSGGDQERYDKIVASSPLTAPPRPRRIYDFVPLDSEDVDVLYFIHRPTAAMPFGRQTIMTSATTVLEDGPLPYTFWPLHRVAHSELFGTPWAYSPFLEILGIQELMDSLETSIASNQSTFATQLITMQEGSDVDIDVLGGGMKVVYVPMGGTPPAALNLTRSPPEVFTHLQNKKKDIEQLMGLNSVVRGEAMTGDQSGSALALLQSQAVQQSAGLQQNYVRFIQSVGNAVLELIRTKCPMPRKIAITGKANQFLQKEQSFKGSDIGQIHKVQVEVGSPLAQTSAGRISLAQEFIKNGFAKTPQQYEQVMATGRLEPLTQSLENELLLICKENEQILEGQQPIVSVDDDHMLHCREHRGVVANPDARKDPSIVAAYMAHIQEHEQLYFGADPRRMYLMGQQPPPPQLMGPPPGAAPQPPQAGPQGAAGNNPAAGKPNDLPAMPVNPATGQQAPSPGGASVGRTNALPPGPKGPGGPQNIPQS